MHRRRALGYKLDKEGLLLLSFARYADRSGHQGPVSNKLVIRWASLPRDAASAYWARRLNTVRVFARYQAVIEPATQIPQRHVFGSANRRKTPHIFAAKELRRLLRCARQLSSGLRALTYQTLIGLLACTGLRISEALNLTVRDVDLEQGLLRVGQSKFQHSRLVPLHPSANRRLRHYARCRSREFPQAQHFFVSGRGLALGYFTACRVFRKLACDLPPSNGRPHVRLHDLRHTFACRVLVNWQRSSRGASGRVAILSRYLGHTHLRDTYWYLTAVPHLLQQAAKHFAPPSP
ncbi:MAG: tyrosine-type recombinase/integrase [Limisphaerales bacterium]